MFSLFKFLVFLLPSNLILWLGEPFKFIPESDIRKLSENYLKDQFAKAQHSHYSIRVIAAIVILVVALILLSMWILAPSIAFIFMMIIGGILLGVDALMLLARFVYASKEQAAAATKGELIVIDDFKDTSLQALLLKRQKEREEFTREFELKHGRMPTNYDFDYR